MDSDVLYICTVLFWIQLNAGRRIKLSLYNNYNWFCGKLEAIFLYAHKALKPTFPVEPIFQSNEVSKPIRAKVMRIQTPKILKRPHPNKSGVKLKGVQTMISEMYTFWSSVLRVWTVLKNGYKHSEIVKFRQFGDLWDVPFLFYCIVYNYINF